MATKKTAPESSAKKIAGKKAAAKTAVKKAPIKKVAAKKAAANAASEAPAKKAAAKRASANYTRPELRDKIKQNVTAGDKGGRPGQWSARKAQLVAHEYEAEGGGYKQPRNPAQQSLKTWGDEHWHTADGEQAIQGNTTHRYLPDAAWDKLSPAEKKATDRKKVAGSQQGKQFVANTPAASEARKSAKKQTN